MAGDEKTADDSGAVEQAYTVVLRSLSHRSRSRFELVTMLRRKKFSDSVLEEALVRAEETGLVDDGDFARRWIADGRRFQYRSNQALEQELLAKGVAREVIREALMDEGAGAEPVVLEGLIAKKVKLERFQDPEKLIAHLMGKGFGYEQIKRVLAVFQDG